MLEAGLAGRGMFALSIETKQLFTTAKFLTMNRFSFLQSSFSRNIAFTLAFLALILSTGAAHAASAINTVRPLGNMEEAIVYQRTLNPYIGITVEHATGAPYAIADKNGKIILKGKINSDKAFFVATARLAKGSYQFRVAGVLMQQFIIQ